MFDARKEIERITQQLMSAQNYAPSSDYDVDTIAQPYPKRPFRTAGVLIPLIERKSHYDMIFTRRSPKMRNHPGQIAFPGGKQDDSDKTLSATALREAHEEIGLHPDQVSLLGQLPTHQTGTAYKMYPFVGLVDPDFSPIAETGEVAEVFSVPLNHLLNMENYTVQGRIWDGRQRHYLTVPFGPYYVWGATARILHLFAEIMNNDHAN